jgi:hypothetical protein
VAHQALSLRLGPRPGLKMHWSRLHNLAVCGVKKRLRLPTLVPPTGSRLVGEVIRRCARSSPHGGATLNIADDRD